MIFSVGRSPFIKEKQGVPVRGRVLLWEPVQCYSLKARDCFFSVTAGADFRGGYNRSVGMGVKDAVAGQVDAQIWFWII